MIDLYLGRTHTQWASEFGTRMNQLPVQSEEYKKCQKIFAWLCNRIRAEQRSDIETLQHNG